VDEYKRLGGFPNTLKPPEPVCHAMPRLNVGRPNTHLALSKFGLTTRIWRYVENHCRDCKSRFMSAHRTRRNKNPGIRPKRAEVCQRDAHGLDSLRRADHANQTRPVPTGTLPRFERNGQWPDFTIR
jgi:hypothetical protein